MALVNFIGPSANLCDTVEVIECKIHADRVSMGSLHCLDKTTHYWIQRVVVHDVEGYVMHYKLHYRTPYDQAYTPSYKTSESLQSRVEVCAAYRAMYYNPGRDGEKDYGLHWLRYSDALCDWIAKCF
jgi:hypothetical protein